MAPLVLDWRLMFCFSFRLEDWIVVVGVQEATEEGIQGHPRSKGLLLAEGLWSQTAETGVQVQSPQRVR